MTDSALTRRLADQYLQEQEARLGKISVAPAPPIGKLLAAELRCHRATLEHWLHQHRGDNIPAVMEAFEALSRRSTGICHDGGASHW
jgi:hypothetical protein